MEFSSPKYKDKEGRRGLFRIPDPLSTMSYTRPPIEMASNKTHISTHHPKPDLWHSSKVNFHWKLNTTEKHENKEIHALVTVT